MKSEIEKKREKLEATFMTVLNTMWRKQTENMGTKKIGQFHYST